jgi:hypothetical protein
LRAGARRCMTVRPRDAGPAMPEAGTTVLLSAQSRPLRRRLRPLVWTVLEEVVLDAVIEDGRLVSRTSARRVAELLQVDPGSAARALRVLRQHGLVGLEGEKGPAGRFGLSVYVLGKVAGLTVLGPTAVEPLPANPGLGGTDRVKPHTAVPGVEKPCADGPYGATPTTALARMASEPGGQERWLGPEAMAPAPADRPHKSAPLELPAVQAPGQRTLDLDWGVA